MAAMNINTKPVQNITLEILKMEDGRVKLPFWATVKKHPYFPLNPGCLFNKDPFNGLL